VKVCQWSESGVILHGNMHFGLHLVKVEAFADETRKGTSSDSSSSHLCARLRATISFAFPMQDMASVSWD